MFLNTLDIYRVCYSIIEVPNFATTKFLDNYKLNIDVRIVIIITARKQECCLNKDKILVESEVLRCRLLVIGKISITSNAVLGNIKK